MLRRIWTAKDALRWADTVLLRADSGSIRAMHDAQAAGACWAFWPLLLFGEPASWRSWPLP
jgi:hypothetical protein